MSSQFPFRPPFQSTAGKCHWEDVPALLKSGRNCFPQLKGNWSGQHRNQQGTGLPWTGSCWNISITFFHPRKFLHHHGQRRYSSEKNQLPKISSRSAGSWCWPHGRIKNCLATKIRGTFGGIKVKHSTTSTLYHLASYGGVKIMLRERFIPRQTGTLKKSNQIKQRRKLTVETWTQSFQ